jgi:hypothetical protein
MRRVHRAFEAFNNLDQDLTRFVEQRILPRCDQFLESWLRDTWPDQTFEDLDPPELQEY